MQAISSVAAAKALLQHIPIEGICLLILSINSCGMACLV
jgi:hypothetical protein